MADSDVEKRLQRIEDKLDTVTVSVDKLSTSVDQRFDEVSDNFVEQRQYTEFAFDRLRSEMHAGFAAVRADMDHGFADMRAGIARLDRRLAAFIEAQLALNQNHERRITAIERRERE
jgi:hypothetical protein